MGLILVLQFPYRAEGPGNLFCVAWCGVLPEAHSALPLEMLCVFWACPSSELTSFSRYFCKWHIYTKQARIPAPLPGPSHPCPPSRSFPYLPWSLPSLPQSFPLVLAFIPHIILATVLASVLAYILPFVPCEPVSQLQNLDNIDRDISTKKPPPESRCKKLCHMWKLDNAKIIRYLWWIILKG